MSDTGPETLKGARIKRIAQHIDTDRFMVTYGDGVSDINISELVDFHIKSGKMATFTGVRMPSRFGSVKTDENGNILSWQEKPVLDEYINFYNSQRPHRKLNMKTPNQYESAFYSGCL